MTGLRILALHGSGTSANIWKAQTQVFRGLLPDDWKFEFIDGDQPCAAADRIDTFYPEPYFCFYNVPSFDNVQNAHEYVHEVLEDDGPFDAIMGFSQGAALAASVILHHQIDKPFSAPLFRFAIFINGSLPFTTSPNLGVDVSQLWVAYSSNDGKVYTPDDNDDNGPEPVSPEESLSIRRFSPSSYSGRIEIPTAHLYGETDPWKPQSLRLVELCDPELATVCQHNGGHFVPRTLDQSKAIADAIMRTFERAQFIVA